MKKFNSILFAGLFSVMLMFIGCTPKEQNSEQEETVETEVVTDSVAPVTEPVQEEVTEASETEIVEQHVEEVK